MSFSWQLKALLNKQLIMMKRNICVTVLEIIFPLIMMLFIVAIRRAFKVTEETISYTDTQFINYNATAYTNLENKVEILSSGIGRIQTVNNASVNYQGIPLRYPLYLL